MSETEETTAYRVTASQGYWLTLLLTVAISDCSPPDIPHTSEKRVRASGPREAAATSLETETKPQQLQGVVSRLLDGDTLELDSTLLVRLIGIDAPERKRRGGFAECYSDEATNMLGALIPPGTEIRLVFDRQRRDKFGRTLAYVYRSVDGAFVNLALIREGAATCLRIPPNERFSTDFRMAERTARIEGAGLWGKCVGASARRSRN